MSQRPLESESWFYPHSNRAQTEANLQKYGRDGSFLVRECENPKGVFVMSYRHDGKMYHSKLDVIEKRYRMAGGRKFDSIGDLVAFYMRHDSILTTDTGVKIRLCYPLYERDRAQIRWFHGRLTEQEASNLLQNNTPGGENYLLHENSSQSGVLLLLVKNGQYILKFPIKLKEDNTYELNGKSFDTMGAMIDHCFKEPPTDPSGKVATLHKPLNRPRQIVRRPSTSSNKEVSPRKPPITNDVAKPKEASNGSRPGSGSSSGSGTSSGSGGRPGSGNRPGSEATIDRKSTPGPIMRRSSTTSDDRSRTISTGSDGDENAPLYQVYHRDAITRNIVQQSEEEEESNDRPPRDLHMMDKAALERRLTKIMRQSQLGTGVPGSRQSCLFDVLKHGMGPMNLWRDLPEVQKGGWLNTMGAGEKRLQEGLFEIITSEASYLKSLNVLIDHYYNAPALQTVDKDRAIISKQNHRVIFSNIIKVQSISKGLLQKLRALKKKSCRLDAAEMATTITDYAKQYFDAYVMYTKNQNFQERELTKLREENQAFNQAILKLEKDPKSQQLPFQSFLLLPVQRITRMPLLVDSALSPMDPSQPGYTQLKECFCVLQKIVVTCNEEAKRLADIEQVAKISEMLDFKTTKTVPLVSQNRSLVKEGELTTIGPHFFGATVHKPFPVYLFLFNDMLVVTKQKGAGSYEVLESAPRTSVRGEVLSEDEITDFLPQGSPSGHPYLILLQMRDKTIKSFLSCESMSDQLRWEEALAPAEVEAPTVKLFNETDCPQAQALQAFEARQPDELSLEESDIVNVTMKLSDGWWQGYRLQDNQKGWFPSSVVVEIQSAHMREKNRRQQHRLMFSMYRQSGEFIC